MRVAPKYVFLSATPQLLCCIAKIMNFLLFCKKNPYYMGLEGIKNKKFRYFFHKVGQIRTNTDGHRIFSLIFAPSESKDAAGSSLTDTYKTPSFPFMRARELKGI